MREDHRKAIPLLVAMSIFILRLTLPVWAAEQGGSKPEVKAAGIMFDFDRKNNWMTIKADGEAEPVKYKLDSSSKNLAKALDTVFNASRVRFTYRIEGESRQLVSIQRHIIHDSGTATGIVVKVHANFWIELKPKHGLADAFAPGANYSDSAFMGKLKELKPGDSVTIQYTTDFERHRIVKLRKNAAQVAPGKQN